MRCQRESEDDETAMKVRHRHRVAQAAQVAERQQLTYHQGYSEGHRAGGAAVLASRGWGYGAMSMVDKVSPIV